MAEMPVVAIVAAFFCATTGFLGWYAFELVRGRERAEKESYSMLIEAQMPIKQPGGAHCQRD